MDGGASCVPGCHPFTALLPTIFHRHVDRLILTRGRTVFGTEHLGQKFLGIKAILLMSFAECFSICEPVVTHLSHPAVFWKKGNICPYIRRDDHISGNWF